MTTLQTPTRTIQISMTSATVEGFGDGIDYSGDYIGNLQILGYSLERPDDLHDLASRAFELFCSGDEV